MADTQTPAPKPSISLPKRPPTLPLGALRRADLERVSCIAIVPSNTTFEQVMTPAFWANHVPTLAARPYARVEVVREDLTMDLDLRVVRTMPGAVFMDCLRKKVDDSNLHAVADESTGETGDLALPPGYKWAHVPKGDMPGHMIRLPNGDVLVRGLKSKAAAAKAARDHYTVTATPTATISPPAPPAGEPTVPA